MADEVACEVLYQRLIAVLEGAEVFLALDELNTPKSLTQILADSVRRLKLWSRDVEIENGALRFTADEPVLDSLVRSRLRSLGQCLQDIVQNVLTRLSNSHQILPR